MLLALLDTCHLYHNVHYVSVQAYPPMQGPPSQYYQQQPMIQQRRGLFLPNRTYPQAWDLQQHAYRPPAGSSYGSNSAAWPSAGARMPAVQNPQQYMYNSQNTRSSMPQHAMNPQYQQQFMQHHQQPPQHQQHPSQQQQLPQHRQHPVQQQPTPQHLAQQQPPQQHPAQHQQQLLAQLVQLMQQYQNYAATQVQHGNAVSTGVNEMTGNVAYRQQTGAHGSMSGVQPPHTGLNPLNIATLLQSVQQIVAQQTPQHAQQLPMAASSRSSEQKLSTSQDPAPASDESSGKLMAPNSKSMDTDLKDTSNESVVSISANSNSTEESSDNSEVATDRATRSRRYRHHIVKRLAISGDEQPGNAALVDTTIP